MRYLLRPIIFKYLMDFSTARYLKGKLGNFFLLAQSFYWPQTKRSLNRQFSPKSPKVGKKSGQSVKKWPNKTPLASDLLWESTKSVIGATVGIHINILTSDMDILRSDIDIFLSVRLSVTLSVCLSKWSHVPNFVKNMGTKIRNFLSEKNITKYSENFSDSL